MSRGPTFIAIDDDTFVVEAMVEELRDAGLDFVGSAGSADGGIALARALRPDVAIVDVQMPGGGHAATKGILEVSGRTTIVVVSAHDTATVRAALLDAGAHRYLVKGRDDVVSEVLDIVNEKGAS